MDILQLDIYILSSEVTERDCFSSRYRKTPQKWRKAKQFTNNNVLALCVLHKKDIPKLYFTIRILNEVIITKKKIRKY